MANKTHESVQDYYGKVLQTNQDLKTNACCTDDAMPAHHKTILKKLAPEVIATYYGCGLPLPEALEGLTILDLGSGSGRDAYLLSALVGPKGHVIGIDMTQEQLDIANKYKDFHADAFGYSTSNVTFKKGFIENLADCGIEDNSVDLVVSNCVINLSPDKQRVYNEIVRVLKPGGEFYISDVFSMSRVPEMLVKDPELYGECLSGAMYVEDFRRVLSESGIHDVRQVSSRQLTIENAEVEKKLGNIRFVSNTVRGFKMPLEDRCEDFGQVAIYKGNLSSNPHQFVLDDHHIFLAKKPMLVCGNTADMLANSRFAKFFDIHGDKSHHFGLFDCNNGSVFSQLEGRSSPAGTSANACC